MLIDLPVLKSNKEYQTQHGLKYENHRRYRSYCSRRLHRIRRSLNVAQGIPSSAKARHQRSRKLLNVTNGMVLEAGEKDEDLAERMLLIPLCLAERAWSYAMQLKQEIAEYPRRRFHLVRRLKKATEYAQKFEALCNDPESPCTDRTKDEATAYAAYITGLYNVEKEDWTSAKNNLTKSMKLYFKLCVSLRNEEVLESYRQLIDELRASIRYCDFSLNVTDEPKVVPAKVSLPANLKFHDLAFKHIQQMELEKERLRILEDEEIECGSRADESMEGGSRADESYEDANLDEEESTEEEDDEKPAPEREDSERAAAEPLGGVFKMFTKKWLF